MRFFINLAFHIVLLGFYMPMSYADKNSLANRHYQWGLGYLNQQEYEKAIHSFTQAIHLDPTLAQALLDRGKTYLQLEKYESAIEDWEIAEKQAPQLAPFDQLHKIARSGILNKEGIEHLEAGRLRQAEKLFHQALTLNPNFSRPYNNLGIIHLDRGRLAINRPYFTPWRPSDFWRKAVTSFNKAIELDSKEARFYINRGNALSQLNRYDQALKDYDKALELDPVTASAYANRAIVYSMQGKEDQAIQDLNTALKLEEQQSEEIKSYKYHRGNRYRSHFKAIMYNSRGMAYARSKQWELAIADYHRALQETDLSSFAPKKYPSRTAKIIGTIKEFFDRNWTDLEYKYEAGPYMIDPNYLNLQVQMVIVHNIKKAKKGRAGGSLLSRCRLAFSLPGQR